MIVRDEDALEAFKKHVAPYFEKLPENVKEIVKTFLEDPEKGMEELLDYCGKGYSEYVSLGKNKVIEIDEILADMALEYQRRQLIKELRARGFHIEEERDRSSFSFPSIFV